MAAPAISPRISPSHEKSASAAQAGSKNNRPLLGPCDQRGPTPIGKTHPARLIPLGKPADPSRPVCNILFPILSGHAPTPPCLCQRTLRITLARRAAILFAAIGSSRGCYRKLPQLPILFHRKISGIENSLFLPFPVPNPQKMATFFASKGRKHKEDRHRLDTDFCAIRRRPKIALPPHHSHSNAPSHPRPTR